MASEDPGDFADLNPAFSSRLNAFKGALDKAGIGYSVISGYRSPEYQGRMYANHLASRAGQPLPYPKDEAPALVAPAWGSFHNYGLAVDFKLNNPNDYSRLASIAPQFGLTGIGASDPGHIQMGGGNLNQVLAANKIASGWRPGDQGTVVAANLPAAAAQPVSASTPAAARPAGGVSFLDDLARIESNNRNIYSTVDPGGAGRSQGYFQIGTPTWTDFAPKAGVNLSQYPNAMSAPRDVQAQVASLIPLSRFGPRTQTMLGQDFGKLDPTKTIGQLASSVPGTTINTSGGPTIAAGGPSAPVAPGQPGQPGQPSAASQGTLPGFTPGSPADKSMQTAAKTLGLGGQGAGGQGGGDEDKPPPPSPMLGPPPQASGGPMMLGQGGQNTFGRSAAQNWLAQQGFLMQPNIGVNTLGGTAAPSLNAAPPGGQAPGSATGITGLPGTTLNSPSQLQMALMTGALNPYDLYASGAYGGAQGIGSM